MNRRFTVTTVSLTASVAFFPGLVVAAPLTPTPVASASAVQAPQAGAARRTTTPPIGIVSFADVVGCVSRGYIGVRPGELDRDFERSLKLGQVEGAPVTLVELLGPACDADIERGSAIMEINRARVSPVEDCRRMTGAARPGDPLAFHLCVPSVGRLEPRTIQVEGQ